MTRGFLNEFGTYGIPYPSKTTWISNTPLPAIICNRVYKGLTLVSLDLDDEEDSKLIWVPLNDTEVPDVKSESS